MIPENTTETDEHWMVVKFVNGKWNCEIGQFFDRGECDDYIAKRKPHVAAEPHALVEYHAARVTETTKHEYDA